MNVARLSSILLATAALTLASCGSESTNSDDRSSDGPTAADLAAMKAAGDDGGGKAIEISNRTYTGGSASVKVSGLFSEDGSVAINQPASITDDGQTWIQYGVSGAEELNLLFTNSEDMAENGINIASGPYTVTATSTSGECQPAIDVTAAKVSGHYSCKGSTGYNKSTGQMGKVDIEVDFEASS